MYTESLRGCLKKENMPTGRRMCWQWDSWSAQTDKEPIFRCLAVPTLGFQGLAVGLSTFWAGIVRSMYSVNMHLWFCYVDRWKIKNACSMPDPVVTWMPNRGRLMLGGWFKQTKNRSFVAFAVPILGFQALAVALATFGAGIVRLIQSTSIFGFVMWMCEKKACWMLDPVVTWMPNKGHLMLVQRRRQTERQKCFCFGV